MHDRDSARDDLTAELERLRGRIAELESRQPAGRRAEEELRESLLRQTAILNNIPDIAWLKDRESRFIAVNGPFGEACGVAPADLVGKTDHDIWPQDLAENYRVDDAEVMRTRKRKCVEERLIGPDGRESWIETIKTPILDAQGAVIGTTGIARDITERRRAEEMLRESQERYRSFFENAAVAVAIVDSEGRVVEANDMDCRFLGYSHAELIGMHFTQFTHPQDIDVDVDQYRSLIAGQSRGYEIEKRYIRKDGKVVWGRLAVSLIRDRQGLPLYTLVVCVDITEHKRAQEALRESDERMQFMMSNSPAVIYTCKPSGDFGATYITSNVMHQMGYEPNDFISDPGFWAAHIHPDDAQRVFAEITALFEEGTLSNEYRFLHKDGSWRWMHDEMKLIRNASGEPVEILGSWVDITERKQAEEALQAAKEYAENLIETANTIVVGLDTRGNIMVFNQAAETITGYSRSELQDRNWFEVIVPKDRYPYVWAEFERLTAKGLPMKFENPILTKSGEERYIVWQNNVMYDHGKIAGTISFGMDITDRKRAEQERLELERRLLHAQKLESLGILAGGIAHDFNNLLMAVLGNLDLALRKLSPVSPARANIEQSAQAARRATDLTRQMLAYSGKGRFEMKTMDLSELVEENAHLFRSGVARTATLDLRLDRSLPAIEADPGQVQQVIMNLITNASEAIGEKAGTITITTGMQDCDEQCLRRSRIEAVPKAGRFVYLEVSDTGCGMDEQTQQRLFDPFFSTKAAGRGLGMSAILGIVRGHEGALFVESAANAGTTIRILLPAIEGASAAMTEAAGAAAEAGTPAVSGTVLVVDDEEIVRNVCKEMVESLSMPVLTASDGREAVEVFQRNADRISHVILDLTMPNMDGMSAFKELVRIRPDVKVVLSSGYNEQESIQRLSGLGHAGFIQKPYSLQNLRDALKKANAAGGRSENASVE